MADLGASAQSELGAISSVLGGSLDASLRFLGTYPWLLIPALVMLLSAGICLSLQGRGGAFLMVMATAFVGLFAFGAILQLFDFYPAAKTGGAEKDSVEPAPPSEAPVAGSPDVASDPAPTAPPNLTWLWVTLGILVIIALVLASWWLAQNVRRAHRRAAAEQEKRRSVALERVSEWQRYRAAVATIQAEYAAFESDVVRPLLWPALTDVRQPETAAFHTCLKAAVDLDFEAVPARDEKIAELGAAVAQLDAAWRTARRTARQIGMSHQRYDVRRAVKKCIRLIEQSRDVRGNTADARAAYAARAMEILGELHTNGSLALPAPVLRQIEAATRPAITA